MLAIVSASALTLGVLVSDLEQGGQSRTNALKHVSAEVTDMMETSQSNSMAPPVWYDCVAQVLESGLLERKLKRLANDDTLVDIEVAGIVRRTINDICADELHEN